MVKNTITKNLETTLNKMGIKDKRIALESPANPDFGDYATAIALKLAKKLKKNPLETAKKLVENLPKTDLIEKTEIIKPGFINFWISKKYLIENLKETAESKIHSPELHLGKNKKVMVEFAHPNTHKLFHIGHLRNISIGESIIRILEAVSNKVIRSNYQGDVGLHIAKCLWYIKNKTNQNELNKIRHSKLHKKISLLGKAYAAGQVAYDEDETAKKEIIKINAMIYKQTGEIIPLWKETRQWSLDYFNEIYKRVYTKFDRLYFESEIATRSLEIVNDSLKKGILEKSDGAIIFNGKKYGLDTRVFVNSLGFPTYEGKELALAEKEFSEFGDLDKIIHVVTPEQKSFFKVTFKVEELLDPEKFKDKQYHLAYEWVKLKQGKMSSRTGNVIEAEWLIDKARKIIADKYKLDQDKAELIAIAAVKYSFLKQDVFTQIAFDFNESISLTGNSGPYLLYTYVRTQSVLKKAGIDLSTMEQLKNETISGEELNLLRTLYQYKETVYKAAKKFSPNTIAEFLFNLAQIYNLFYQKHQILNAEENVRNFRLALTQGVGKIIKEGLYLLGIETVKKM